MLKLLQSWEYYLELNLVNCGNFPFLHNFLHCLEAIIIFLFIFFFSVFHIFIASSIHILQQWSGSLLNKFIHIKHYNVFIFLEKFLHDLLQCGKIIFCTGCPSFSDLHPPGDFSSLLSCWIPCFFSLMSSFWAYSFVLVEHILQWLSLEGCIRGKCFETFNFWNCLYVYLTLDWQLS